MRFKVTLRDEAKAQLRSLAPDPRRLVRRVLREMEDNPFALDYRQLDRPEVVYRIREGDYRIVFEPGPGHREGHRGAVTTPQLGV